jgi:hypothetical protein
MEKTYGRLIDEVEKLDRKRRMYIGTKNGSGYFRLTSFNSKENTQEAVERIRRLIK